MWLSREAFGGIGCLGEIYLCGCPFGVSDRWLQRGACCGDIPTILATNAAPSGTVLEALDGLGRRGLNRAPASAVLDLVMAFGVAERA